jgi:hypothetical protein
LLVSAFVKDTYSNALGDATIEASECLKAWWDQGLITRD